MRSRGTFRFWKRAPSFTIGLTFRFADYNTTKRSARDICTDAGFDASVPYRCIDRNGLPCRNAIAADSALVPFRNGHPTCGYAYRRCCRQSRPHPCPAADEDAPRNRLLLRTSELFQGIQATDQVVLKIAAEKVLIRWKQRG